MAEVTTTHYTCVAAMVCRLARVRARQPKVQSKCDVRNGRIGRNKAARERDEQRIKAQQRVAYTVSKQRGTANSATGQMMNPAKQMAKIAARLTTSERTVELLWSALMYMILCIQEYIILFKQRKNVV